MAAAMEQAAIIYLDKRGILFCRLLWGGERMGQERGLMVVEEREGGECIMKNGDEKNNRGPGGGAPCRATALSRARDYGKENVCRRILLSYI